ncbi:transcription factor hoxa13 [Rhodotorula toruloides]|uniref:Transcription factor hoxa13 n=1 Tax=Rhodotorula toruloides TaxID=5286 RepID=A0A511KH21_RHOTO|nr:transcription factor hoxa13 [Rhodotorula toruloides]
MPPRSSLGAQPGLPTYLPASQSAGRNNQQQQARRVSDGRSDQRSVVAGPSRTPSSAYEPGAPIKFYDEEVKKMHDELDKRAPEERVAARQAMRSPSTRRRKRGVTWTGFFLRVAAAYVLIAYFFVCPNGTSDRAICRGLDSVGDRLRRYEPHVRPYVQTAQRKLEPYVAEVERHTKPYVDVVRPHYHRADRLVRPHVSTAYRFVRLSVYPAILRAVRYSQAATQPIMTKLRKQYVKTLEPSVEWYSDSLGKWYAAHIEPHITRYSFLVRKHSQTAYDAFSPVWETGVPRARHHWRTHLVPFSRRAYSTSRKTYTMHVHPRAVTVGGHTARFYRSKILPTLHRFWSKFIAPQLDKIRERIFEYKAKKAKLEAVQRVEKVSEEIAEERGEKDLNDFIKDLRDDKIAADASPAIFAEEAPPAYSASVPPPPPSASEAAALRAEKRAALETLQSTYEKEIAALGQTEHRLLVERLVDIRQRAIEDIPARFEPALEKLDEEGDAMVGKLGKYFARVGADEETPVEEKINDSEDLCAKAERRVRKTAEAIKKEVEEYRVDLEMRERAAVEKAQQAVGELVSKAQDNLGTGWTWLDGVTAKDWQRYHGLRRAEENLDKNFAALQTGAIKEPALADLRPYSLLDQYHESPDNLVAAFEKILHKIKVKGQRELKGEWQGVVPEAQAAYEAVTGKIAAVVDDLKVSASSVAGYERKPTNVAQSMSSLAKAAQASASSLAAEAVKALPTIEARHEYLEAVKSAYGDASQQVLRAAGVEPSPTNFRQSASSLAHAASESAATAYAEASQSALRALGKEPSPTDLAQSMTSIANVASASAASAYSQVMSDYPASISSALAAATQAVDRAADDALSSASSLAASAASVVSSLAAPAATMLSPAPVADAIEGAKAAANEFFGEVSQDALRAVGQEPSPTNFAQSATSLGSVVSSSLLSVSTAAASSASVGRSSASSRASAATRRAAATASGMSASASSLASSMSSRASQGVSSGVSVASSLNKPHPSYKKSQASASIASGTDGVKRRASSVVSAAAKKVAGTGAVRRPPAVVKSASSVASAVKSKAEESASPHPSYMKSQRQEKVAQATDKVKKVIAHGEL